MLIMFYDETNDILSNITLCLSEFQRAKSKGTPKGTGLYLTIYPELSNNTDMVSFLRIIVIMTTSLVSLVSSLRNLFHEEQFY